MKPQFSTQLFFSLLFIPLLAFLGGQCLESDGHEESGEPVVKMLKTTDQERTEIKEDSPGKNQDIEILTGDQNNIEERNEGDIMKDREENEAEEDGGRLSDAPKVKKKVRKNQVSKKTQKEIDGAGGEIENGDDKIPVKVRKMKVDQKNKSPAKTKKRKMTKNKNKKKKKKIPVDNESREDKIINESKRRRAKKKGLVGKKDNNKKQELDEETDSSEKSNKSITTSKKHPVFSFSNYLLAECGNKYNLRPGISYFFTTDGGQVSRNCRTSFTSPPGTTIRFSCPVFNLHLKRCKLESLLLVEKKKAKWPFCKIDVVDVETIGNKLQVQHKRRRLPKKRCPGAFLCEIALHPKHGTGPVKPHPVTVKPHPVPVKPHPVPVKPHPVTVKPHPVTVKPHPTTMKPATTGSSGGPPTTTVTTSTPTTTSTTTTTTVPTTSTTTTTTVPTTSTTTTTTVPTTSTTTTSTLPTTSTITMTTEPTTTTTTTTTEPTTSTTTTNTLPTTTTITMTTEPTTTTTTTTTEPTTSTTTTSTLPTTSTTTTTTVPSTPTTTTITVPTTSTATTTTVPTTTTTSTTTTEPTTRTVPITNEVSTTTPSTTTTSTTTTSTTTTTSKTTTTSTPMTTTESTPNMVPVTAEAPPPPPPLPPPPAPPPPPPPPTTTTTAITTTEFTTRPPIYTAQPGIVQPPSPIKHRPFCPNCSPTDIAITRIIGGVPASEGEFPFQARVMVYGSLCSGTLISLNFVLTAAHCFNHGHQSTTIYLGDYNQNVDEFYTQVISAQKVITHKDFNKSTMDNDIAIVELSRQAVITHYVAPACIATNQDNFRSSMAVSSGWGHTQHGGSKSDILLKVALDIITNAECKTMYQDKPTFTITNNMLCTYTVDKDACQGDSGGPLMRKTSDGTWVVVGIVSYGDKCANPGSPGVFTNVEVYETWIEQNIRILNC